MFCTGLSLTRIWTIKAPQSQIDYIPSMSSATAGALLFVISDSLLAYDKYVGRIKNRDFLILSTYFVGQFLIAWSVVVK